MRGDHLQNIFGLLSLLGTASVHASTDATPKCDLQAWVRAPDLTPGTIIQGDARLKLSAGCTAVESTSLGLRFKERSFVKASRSIEKTKRPTREQKVIDPFNAERTSPSSPWVLPLHRTVNCSADIAFEEIVKNRNLWSVREEERVVFESTQAIHVEEPQSGSVRDVVQDFAILVPLTNFPPALDYPRSHIEPREEEFVNVEMMYEYFVRVAFKNGTRVEIPAGFTAFHPLYDPPSDDLMQTKTVQLQTKESLDGNIVDEDPVANYTATITSKNHGFAFSQGSDDQFIEVSITRTGRARTFVEPLTLYVCINSNLSPKWASEYTSNPTLQSLLRPNQILRATTTDFKNPTSKSTSRCDSRNPGNTPPNPISMPNATAAQITAGEIVTTTSTPVQFLIDPDLRHSTDFETYYQTLLNALFLSFDVPRTQDESPNTSDFFELRALRKKTPEVDLDEEAWVPWYRVPEVTRWRGARAYTGNVSVSVYPAPEAHLPRHCVRADRPAVDSEQVVVSTDEHERYSDCALRSPVHYLSEGARAPTFVDVNDNVSLGVRELLTKTPAERDPLAPFLAPVVSFPPEGEELVHRYYRVPEGQRPLIYVGETWVKKVAHRDEHEVVASRPDAMPAVLANVAQAMKHMFDEL